MKDAAISSMPAPFSRVMEGKLLGYVAMALTVAIWSSFALSIRAIGASSLTAADVSLIRFGVPAVICLPLLAAHLPVLAKIRPAPFFMIAIGAGLPFFLLAAFGGHFASAAHVGALVAGTSPLFVAIICRALFGERIAGRSMLGLCLILSGVGALVFAQGAIGMKAAAGILLLLGASLLWSIYTVGLRRAAIDAVTCTMIVVYPSIAALGIAMKLGFLASNIACVGFAEIWPYIVIQGLGVGLGSTLTYAIAITRLGATRCATLGALSPVLTALAAIPFLGEGLGVFTIVGVLLVTAGVLYPRSAKK